MVRHTLRWSVQMTLLATVMAMNKEFATAAASAVRHGQTLPDVNAHSANGNADVVAAAAEGDMREHAKKTGKHRDFKALSTYDRPGMKTVFPNLASFDLKTLLLERDMANQHPAPDALVIISSRTGHLRNLGHHRRRLARCSNGDSFSVTSSLHPEAEGCYNSALGLEQINGERSYYTDTSVVFAAAILSSSESSSADPTWVVALPMSSTSSSTTLVYLCRSDEPAGSVHPAEATWLCGEESTSATSWETVSRSEFSSSCGCDSSSSSPSSSLSTPSPTSSSSSSSSSSSTPAPSSLTSSSSSSSTPAPSSTSSSSSTTSEEDSPEETPAPTLTATAAPTAAPTTGGRDLEVTPAPTTTPTAAVTPAPTAPPTAAETLSPVAPTSCDDGEEFVLSTPTLSDAERCFVSTIDSIGDGVATYTTTGSVGNKQFVVSANEFSNSDYLWMFWHSAGSTSDAESVIYCHSSEQAGTVHPVDATWQCDFKGGGKYAEVSASEMNIKCGCASTLSPTAPSITPSPSLIIVPPSSQVLSTSSASRVAPDYSHVVFGAVICIFVTVVTGRFANPAFTAL